MERGDLFLQIQFQVYEDDPAGIPSPIICQSHDQLGEVMSNTCGWWVENLEDWEEEGNDVDTFTFLEWVKHRKKFLDDYSIDVLIFDTQDNIHYRPSFEELCLLLIENPKINIGEVVDEAKPKWV